ncbi:MAG TPA: sugar ABC transporter permease [Firmicutes bacterium]|nr:sugar ABC transporter permease [Bacillota bacterium]
MVKSRFVGRRLEALEGYLFISPWLLGFLFFTAGPLLASFLMSFTRWNIVTQPRWVGLDNFSEIFLDDPLFKQSLKVTFIYTVFSVPLQLAVGLALSLLLNKKLRAMNLYRTIFYLPSVISGVAVSMMWLWVFNKDFGVLNQFLGLFGISGPNWLGHPYWALPSLIFMKLWGVGSTTIIYLAGLQNIPPYLYEAATIDGASKWKQFWRITLPMLSPTMFFLMVMEMISAFQAFTQGYVMTQGGPMRATYFYVLYLYNEAFGHLNMGYGAALAWILALIILAFTMMVFKSSPLWVFYEAERRNN